MHGHLIFTALQLTQWYQMLVRGVDEMQECAQAGCNFNSARSSKASEGFKLIQLSSTSQ